MAEMVVKFRVFGEVEARVAGQLVDLGHARQRCVLVTLLVEANHPVSADQLVDRVWGGRPPLRARGTLYSYLSRLRHALATVDDELGLMRQSGGYVLMVDPLAVDLHRFHHLVTQARGAPSEERALSLFEQALGLWQGEAFASLDTAWLNTVRDGLERERLAVELDRNDLQLRRGQHPWLLGALATQAAVHPMDERLAGQLMLALYRCGRQADALEYFHQMRRRLAEELGIDPEPPLHQLYQQILATDPALTAPTRTTRSAPASAESPVPTQLPADVDVLPAQLPPDLPDFTAREAQLAVLRDQLADAASPGAVVICAIAGKPGVGKTALAVHVAHQLRDEFPDGQLYVNLRGTESQALNPVTVLARFLRVLGVDSSAIPDDVDERAAMYRSQLADRRMLVLLDNAASEAQVRPLLPGAAGCAVMVTSRARLAGLAGKRLIELDVLDTDQAIELLARVAGADRVDAEPGSAAQIVRHCGQLPLAVRIAAARLVARPHWRLARLATNLADEHRRLDELRLGDLEVRASLTLSYLGLEPDEQRALRRLALLDAPDFTSWVAAALLNCGLDQADDIVERLVDAQLLEISGDDATGHHRYRFHDLIRLYAREYAQTEESVAERAAAIERAVGAWLALAEQASRQLVGEPDWLEHGDALRWAIDPQFVDALLTAPSRWFESERLCLIAAVEQAAAWGLAEASWSLANSLGDFLELGKYRDECIHVHEVALDSTSRDGHRLGEGIMRHNLAALYSVQGRYDESLRYLEHAQAAFGEVGDLHGQARVNQTRGIIYRHVGRAAEASENFVRALPAFREIGDRRGEAYTLTNIGALHLDEGRSTEAAECFEQSLSRYRDIGHRTGEAHALRYIGRLRIMQGQLDEAVRYLTQCLRLYCELDDSIGSGYALQALGETYAKQGRQLEARIQLEQSLKKFRETHHRHGEALCLDSLAELLDAESRFDEALIRLDEAMDIWRQLSLPLQQARTLRSIGAARAGAGNYQAARTAWREALATFRELGIPDAELASRLGE